MIEMNITKLPGLSMVTLVLVFLTRRATSAPPKSIAGTGTPIDPVQIPYAANMKMDGALPIGTPCPPCPSPSPRWPPVP